jgi:hypothetical protein
MKLSRFAACAFLLPLLLVNAGLAHAKKKTIAAARPPLETYSAYDPSQDPDADQSSTFEEPLLLEQLDLKPKAVALSSPPPVSQGKPLAAAKRITQLPSGVKAAPKVVVRPAPAPKASSAKVFLAKKEAAVVKAEQQIPGSAPAPTIAPKAILSLRTAVENARYSSPASPRLMPKKEYVAQSCEAWNGIVDYALSDGSRADCVTMEFAFEFAYADGWEEALGRALNHGRRSGLTPALAVIIEREEDLAALESLLARRRSLRLNLFIKKIMLPEVSRALAP